MISNDSLQFLMIDGHKLAALRLTPEGEGMPVIFIHGVTQSVHFWIPAFTAAFHEQGPCYALSLPGHFPAEFPRDFDSAALTPELMASLLADPSACG
jgi:pimeloyl-ACP methyl ester carboxylesterase